MESDRTGTLGANLLPIPSLLACSLEQEVCQLTLLRYLH